MLKELAGLLGLAEGTYDIRSNMGGIAVSGEVTLHGENIYVQLSQSSIRDYFMWRTCQGRKDYTGGTNQWASWKSILDLPVLASQMKAVVSRKLAGAPQPPYYPPGRAPVMETGRSQSAKPNLTNLSTQ